jgi:2-polyprenyl-6-methoxyphenol hydroxylase-like FAD-dependent oxidoreductase
MTAIDVRGAVAELDDLVSADGARFELERWDDTTSVVRLRLVIGDDACAECVVPRELLETIALNRLRQAVPGVAAVTIVDPREATP